MQQIGIMVPKGNAEEIRRRLLSLGIAERGLETAHSAGSVIFPLKQSALSAAKKIAIECHGAGIVQRHFAKIKRRPGTMRDALRGKLSGKLLALVPSSFDLLGDVAIIELDKRLLPKATEIGRALMKANKHVESVYLKTGAHNGIFRSEPVRLVAGRKKKCATYRELGCTFRITLGKVFFSPRLATERKRICSLIKPGEHVAALFAGVGPFPIVFAKNSGMERAVAIELNPVAVEDMKSNISINKADGKVEPVLGDVKALSSNPEYFGKFDRAVMPLPKGGEDFLADAIKYIRPSGGIVHYYQFVPRERPFELPKRQIEAACKSLGRKFEVLFERKVREYAPDIIQVVIDFKVFSG